ncbi:MAG: guanylate kinase [Lachnospiraceae bacterium]
MEKKGNLIVISGFSGAGKGTVVKDLVKRYGYSLSVSATTRSPRPGEIDGVHYHFKTEEDFLNLIDYNGFIEYTQYVEHYYGTPRAFVEKEMEAGRDVILEIEVNGALNIKKQYPQTILIFIAPPSVEELKERLIGRQSESLDVIEKRLSRAKEEAKDMDNYEYIVLNENNKVEKCADTIHSIVLAKKRRLEENIEFVAKIKNEMNHLNG